MPRWTYEALGALLLAVVLFGLTEIPYAVAPRRVPPGTVFSGHLEYNEDLNVYYTFIRQGSEGRWLFANRATHLDHDPAFFNLEWLAVGRLAAATGQERAFQVWRAAGAVALLLGFAALARTALPQPRQRRVALLMCATGGGFGWLAGASARPLDLSMGIHPFVQILWNPHFSLSAGLFLLFAASYTRGEQGGGARWYGVAAALAFADGLVRPYDLITLFAALALFLALDALHARSLRRTALRCLPLAVCAPLLVYYVWLFRVHPVFRYWSDQGVMPAAPLAGELAGLGLAGLLLLARLALLRRMPLRGPIERLLLAWLAAVVLLIHANRLPGLSGLMPYSPQLWTTLVPPVILLGLAPWRLRPGWLVALLLALNAASSATLLAREYRRAGTDSTQLLRTSYLEAFRWLDRNGEPDDLVVCSYPTGNRFARRAPVRVVLGHWSVTPEIARHAARVRRFYAEAMEADEARAFLAEVRARWVLVGPEERSLGGRTPDPALGLEAAGRFGDVVVYARPPGP